MGKSFRSLSSSFVPGCDHPRMPQTTPVMTVQLRCQQPEIHSVTSAFDNRAKMKSGTATKTIFGGSDTLIQTCSSKPWGTGLLIGYSAGLRDKPVQVKVEYERPSLDSATVHYKRSNCVLSRSTESNRPLLLSVCAFACQPTPTSAAEHARVRMPTDSAPTWATSRPLTI